MSCTSTIANPQSRTASAAPTKWDTPSMLAKNPRLLTRRPSPTTVEYTLSTAPPPTPSTIALHALLLALRLALLLLAILLPISQFGAHIPSPTLHSLLATPAAKSLTTLTTTLPTPVAPIAALLLASAALRRVHTTESVLVLRGLGIQTRSSSPVWGLGSAARFIPTEKIRDVLVNEVFVGFGVRYVLVVIVEGEEDMVVVFPRLGGRKEV
ncbi:hypothetical protein IMZ48_40625, partial [Candidatus Bathyarchaeota archaeon]|nr:hypothetical protein [Candidatus Bathyarchaeota archaeon]